VEDVMIIFPAIDIKDSKCVRLIKGDFNKITSYNNTPLDQAKLYLENGFKNIHIVDLDGALEGKSSNSNIVQEIIKNLDIKIQIGGGIRTLEDVNNWEKSGADKIIMGTAAVKNIDLLKAACEKFKNKIAVSLDVRDGFIALSGWENQTNISAIDFIKKIENFGVSRIIYTDINKDGTKKGPNIKDTIEASSKVKIPFIISGGISSIEDIKKIKSLNNPNIEGVIVGKSIYDGDIKINELAKYI
tara:strand:- start:294 stop:1025 length:732 start_codon:yes stop_codon:yes gene_type:complete